jgi:hypothetical protein
MLCCREKVKMMVKFLFNYTASLEGLLVNMNVQNTADALKLKKKTISYKYKDLESKRIGKQSQRLAIEEDSRKTGFNYTSNTPA